jgi:hypothetical protein
LVIEDHEGNVWIVTDGKGLHRIRKAQINSFAAEEGLIDGTFLAMKDVIYFHTRSSLLKSEQGMAASLNPSVL